VDITQLAHAADEFIICYDMLFPNDFVDDLLLLILQEVRLGPMAMSNSSTMPSLSG